MSAYSGYRGGSSMLTAYVCIFVFVGIALLGISMLLESPVPPHEATGGVDIGKAVEEARSLIPDLVPGGEAEELSSSTGGYLRVLKRGGGRVVIMGHSNVKGLLAAAEAIAAQLGVDVEPW